jgi:hypothetical protein
MSKAGSDRPPYGEVPPHINYGEHGSMGCYSAAIAFLMYRIGAPESLWHPKNIDAITGRQPGKPTANIGLGRLALLDQGAEMITMEKFDSQRYLQHGLAYLAEHHSDGWLAEDPAGFFRYWTPQRIQDDMAQVQSYLVQTEPYRRSGQLRQYSTTPLMQDIARLTRANYDVMFNVATSSTSTVHTIVATKYYEEPGKDGAMEASLVCFDYINPTTPMIDYDATDLQTRIDYNEDFVAVRRPSR